jgi:hypothetical protein
VGQEPTTQFHHIGLLGLTSAFTPKRDFLQDYRDAVKHAEVVFVPHPTGWWPKNVYGEEARELLNHVPSPFLMEICNGANNIISAFDFTDEDALRLWDRLLISGKVVHAMGNTDAHAPHAIGTVWNGVYASKCDQQLVQASLKKGRHFVSNGPLIHIECGGKWMGSTVKRSARTSKLNFTCVDSRGLSTVAVVADGKELFSWNTKHAPSVSKSLVLPKKVQRYVRVEAWSRDGARAFSNPIYFS